MNMNDMFYKFIIALLMLLAVFSVYLGIAYNDNTIIGYSEHGVPILLKDLKD